MKQVDSSKCRHTYGLTAIQRPAACHPRRTRCLITPSRWYSLNSCICPRPADSPVTENKTHSHHPLNGTCACVCYARYGTVANSLNFDQWCDGHAENRGGTRVQYAPPITGFVLRHIYPRHVSWAGMGQVGVASARTARLLVHPLPIFPNSRISISL
jgi:hypothetical protein